MKLLSIIAIACVTLLFSCQSNPQKKAEKKAEKLEHKANVEAGAAEAALDKGMEKAADAIVHATEAELNEAMAKVKVPELSNLVATQHAKKIGNHGIDWINSKDYKHADKYATKIAKDLQKVDDLEAEGAITKEDAVKIRNYASDLASAINLEIVIVE